MARINNFVHFKLLVQVSITLLNVFINCRAIKICTFVCIRGNILNTAF